MRLTVNELRTSTIEFLVDEGLREDHAANVADVLVEAEMQGLGSHGLGRLPQYVRQLRTGGLNRKPDIRIERLSATTSLVIGDHALGAVAGLRAVEELKRTAMGGFGLVAVRGAGHVGPLSAYVERLAIAGLVGLAFVNSPPAIAAPGGSVPILGTNPIAFAAPGATSPLVVDLSLSVAARGKILQAAKQGEAIPEDWAVDENGFPTTDPHEALKGAVLPIGGAKGFALALVVEVLAGVLAGDLLSANQALPWVNPESRASIPGLMLLALDPTLLKSRGSYLASLSQLAVLVHESGGRIPGERREAARRDAERNGVELSESLLASLREVGFGLASERGA